MLVWWQWIQSITTWTCLLWVLLMLEWHRQRIVEARGSRRLISREASHMLLASLAIVLLVTLVNWWRGATP